MKVNSAALSVHLLKQVDAYRMRLLVATIVTATLLALYVYFSEENQVQFLVLAPFETASGFSQEAAELLRTMKSHARIQLLGSQFSSIHSDTTMNMLNEFSQKDISASHRTALLHVGTPTCSKPKTVYSVARYMFETDRLPTGWADIMNNCYDEVWVPSPFNRLTFITSGVSSNKLRVVKPSINTDEFNPMSYSPLYDIEQEQKFVFLTIFHWTMRKDWQSLLRAYFTEFSAKDEVVLVLKTNKEDAFGESTTQSVNDGYKFIFDFAKGMGLRKEQLPKFIVIVGDRDDMFMKSLLRTADAFVLPSHGEGIGRPYLEAMSMELPVIATNWSGNTYFMNNDNSYLLNYDMVEVTNHKKYPFYNGHRWAQVDLNDLKRTMRHVFENRAEAAIVGTKARKFIRQHFDTKVVEEEMNLIIQSLAQKISEKEYITGESSKLSVSVIRSIRQTSFTCFGLNITNPNVCSGHGTCIARDSCNCTRGWTGTQCAEESRLSQGAIVSSMIIVVCTMIILALSASLW